MTEAPVDEIAYIIDDMRENGKMADLANRLGRQHMRLCIAILDFCNAFTMVYPPDDPDCPALLAGAFENFKDAMGIETVSATKGANQ